MKLRKQKQTSLSPLLRPSSTVSTWIGLPFILICYVAVCCFWHYLTTSQWYNFSAASYRDSFFHPIGYAMLEPLSIFCYPWMIIITSLMLGAIMFVPAATAIMYRMPVCMVMVATAFFIGHAPLLSIAMLIGCSIVCLTSFRHDIFLLAMTLAFVPVGLYLYFFACLGVDSGGVAAIQRWLLGVPLIAGFVLAAIFTIGAILLGKLNFLRPLVIIPLLLGLVIPSVVFFYKKVGQDRLQYAILIQDLGQPDELFPPTTVEAWKSRPDAAGLSGQSLLQNVRDDLAGRKSAMASQCRKFLADNSKSKLRPAVMWLAAQSTSLQVDAGQLNCGAVKYTAQWVMEDSAQAWADLAREYSGTLYGAVANWHLSELSIRSMGQADSGMDDLRMRQLLEEARLNLMQSNLWIDGILARQDKEGRDAEFPFMSATLYPGRHFYVAARLSIIRLLWLIDRCNIVGDSHSARIFGRWLAINPSRGDYVEQLGKLLDEETRSLPEGEKPPVICNHLKLALAMATPDMAQRSRMLMSLSALAINEAGGVDIHACYELGAMAISVGKEGREKLYLSLPEDYFKIVARTPDNPWQQTAAEFIASLRDDSGAESKKQDQK